LLKAVAEVQRGSRYLSHSLAIEVAVVGVPPQSRSLADLTPRELDALILLAKGKTYNRIAEDPGHARQWDHQLSVLTLIGPSALVRITEQSTGARRFWSLPRSVDGNSRRRITVAGTAFLMAMIGVASCILGGLYLLFRDDHPSDEAKKRRKRLLVSNWKSPT
jgi:hypothetical protein